MPGAPVLTGEAFGAALEPHLTPWIGPDAWPAWQRRLAGVPRANRLFLECHLGLAARRCDIVSSITAADGTLAAWAAHARVQPGCVWQEAGALLQAWQRQLVAGEGALWADCLMMWFEFDLAPEASDLDAPSLFIALRPGAALEALGETAAVFPDLQTAIARFAAWLGRADPAFRAAPLLLGHIGYMAARAEPGEVLPLRSCWRCDDAAHLAALLALSGLKREAAAFKAALARLGDLIALGNSLMLDLDIGDRPQGDFAIEINLFQRDGRAAAARIGTVLRLLADLALVTPAEAAALRSLTTVRATAGEGSLFCLPHHVKIRFRDGRIDGAKLYWLARVTGHPEAQARASRPVATCC